MLEAGVEYVTGEYNDGGKILESRNENFTPKAL